MTDDQQDHLAGDAAMTSVAHSLRTYYLALVAEGFSAMEALTVVIARQAQLLAGVAPPVP